MSLVLEALQKPVREEFYRFAPVGEELYTITLVQEQVVGEWLFFSSPQEIKLPEEMVEQGRQIVEVWAGFFPEEKTWVRQKLGVPSLITRLDATVNNQGKMEVYEVEERPAGIGLSSVLNSDFATRLGQVRAGWPNFKVFVSPQRRGFDDHLWLEMDADPKNSDNLLLIRAEPEEEEYHPLEERSVSSLIREGDKSYGEKMGLWTRVTDPDGLNWDKPFVLKLLQGTKMQGVYIWHPDKLPGSHTRTKILKELANHPEGMYQQPFHSPIPVHVNGKEFWMILRVYFAYNIEELRWEYLGGLWNARPNLRVHGATDAVFGPIK